MKETMIGQRCCGQPNRMTDTNDNKDRHRPLDVLGYLKSHKYVLGDKKSRLNSSRYIHK